MEFLLQNTHITYKYIEMLYSRKNKAPLFYTYILPKTKHDITSYLKR